MDKTTYLNHYYFISILSFLMLFIPANATFSIDNLIKGKVYKKVPQWTIDSLKVLLSIVYIYSRIIPLIRIQRCQNGISITRSSIKNSPKYLLTSFFSVLSGDPKLFNNIPFIFYLKLFAYYFFNQFAKVD